MFIFQLIFTLISLIINVIPFIIIVSIVASISKKNSSGRNVSNKRDYNQRAPFVDITPAPSTTNWKQEMRERQLDEKNDIALKRKQQMRKEELKARFVQEEKYSHNNDVEDVDFATPIPDVASSSFEIKPMSLDDMVSSVDIEQKPFEMPGEIPANSISSSNSLTGDFFKEYGIEEKTYEWEKV